MQCVPATTSNRLPAGFRSAHPSFLNVGNGFHFFRLTHIAPQTSMTFFWVGNWHFRFKYVVPRKTVSSLCSPSMRCFNSGRFNFFGSEICNIWLIQISETVEG